MTDKERIEELEEKLKRQAEWIENNKNKAKNCAIQMNNQAKEITRLRQSNKDLMAVIRKTKRERATKGREVCQARNETVKANKNQNQKAVDALQKVKELIREEVVYIDDQYFYQDTVCKVIDQLISELGGKDE